MCAFCNGVRENGGFCGRDVEWGRSMLGEEVAVDLLTELEG